jgi:hypothetical protein
MGALFLSGIAQGVHTKRSLSVWRKPLAASTGMLMKLAQLLKSSAPEDIGAMIAMMERTAMPATDDGLNAMLDATAGLLGLAIAPAWRGEVLAHMKVIANSAQLLAEFPLDEETVPAPVFCP